MIDILICCAIVLLKNVQKCEQVMQKLLFGSQRTSPSTQLTNPSIQLTNPSIQLTIPSTKLTIPSTQLTIPSTQVTIPVTQLTIPSTQVTIPSTQLKIPSIQLPNPGTRPQKLEKVEYILFCLLLLYKDSWRFCNCVVDFRRTVVPPPLLPLRHNSAAHWKNTLRGAHRSRGILVGNDNLTYFSSICCRLFGRRGGCASSPLSDQCK